MIAYYLDTTLIIIHYLLSTAYVTKLLFRGSVMGK